MKTREGMTVIEVLVSIVVGAMFIITIYQIAAVNSTLSVSASQRMLADSLAYSNFRLYADGASPTWFDCTAATNNGGFLDFAPPATSIKTEAAALLPYFDDTNTKVTVSAPYGCGGSPLLIKSKVVYGQSGNITVTYAGYASYY